MNKKFKMEFSIFVMGSFIAIVGVLFLIARSDAILTFRYFNETAEQSILRQEVKADTILPSYLLLTGKDQPKLHESLAKRLELMGKTVEVRPISSFKPETDLANYTSVIVATEQLNLLEEPDTMLQFVKEGGSIFFAVRPSPDSVLTDFYEPLGIMKTSELIETSGVQLEQPFFGDQGDLAFQAESIKNSSLSVKLSDDAKLFASSSSGTPLLWSNLYGGGTFTVFNGTMLRDMTNHALFVKGIQQSTDHVIMPIVNAHITELSGFPFFVADGRDLSPSYSNHDYYRKIVWPELQRIESKYDLNYTASYLATDDAMLSDEQPSFVLDELQLYSRELLRMGGEIAVQEPLSTTAEQAAHSWENSVRQIEEALPGYPIRSIVSSAPATDLSLVKEVSAILMPNKYVEKKTETIILPKTAEGFILNEDSKWKLFNSVAANGFYSHSLYPYRFIEEGDAEGKMAAFASFQESIQNQVPWIRSLTLSKAADAASTYINSELYEEQKGETLTFHATAMKEETPSYYYFSTNRNVLESENCEVEKIGEDLYLVAANELTFSLVLGGV